MVNYFRLTLLLGVGAFLYYFYGDESGIFKSRRAPQGVELFCKESGQVALTFDGGPSPFTKSVFEVLAQTSTVATFHVVTSYINTISSRVAIETANNNGHLVGLRFPTNLNPSKMSPQAFRATLISESDKIYEVIQKYPKFLRLPDGQFDASHVEMAKSFGFIVTRWNIDTFDFELPNNDSAIDGLIQPFQDAFDLLDPEKGRYISLQSDLAELYSNTTFLTEQIEYIKDRGYQFVRLDKCILNSSNGYREKNEESGSSSSPDIRTNSSSDSERELGHMNPMILLISFFGFWIMYF